MQYDRMKVVYNIIVLFKKNNSAQYNKNIT